MAVRPGRYLLTLRKGSRRLRPRRLRKLLRISYLEHKTNDWVRSKVKLPCELTGTLSGNCQETETGMVRECHTPRQPLENNPSRHLGVWATPWSVAEMLDERRQRLDVPVHAKTAYDDPPQKRLEEDLC